MAPTIKNLVGKEVEIFLPSSGATKRSGLLVAEDDRGILFTEGSGDDVHTAFVPWSSVAVVRARGEHKPKPQRTQVVPKPRGL